MNNEDVFKIMEEMFSCSNQKKIIKLGNVLKSNNIEMRDLNTRLVVYNNGERIIVPTIGKGTNRKYLFEKYRIENA